MLWRDGATGCFAPLRGMSSARQFEWLPVSILASIEPDGAIRLGLRYVAGLRAQVGKAIAATRAPSTSTLNRSSKCVSSAATAA